MIVFFGNHSFNGIIDQQLDEDMKIVSGTTIEGLFANWQANA